MEKIFKKSLALVLSAALCLTALVGCLTVSAEGTTAKPTYALDAVEGKPGDTVTVTATLSNLNKVCAEHIKVTFPAGLAIGDITDGNGKVYTRLTETTDVTDPNLVGLYSKTTTADNGTLIQFVDFVNWPNADGTYTNVVESLVIKFAVTISAEAVAGHVYDITAAVDAADYAADKLMDVALTPGKITVKAAVACDHANKTFYTDDEHVYVPATGDAKGEKTKGYFYFKCNDCNEIIREETSYYHYYTTGSSGLTLQSEILTRFYVRKDHYEKAGVPTKGIIVLKKDYATGTSSYKVVSYDEAADGQTNGKAAKLVTLGIQAKEMNDNITSSVFVFRDNKWYNGATIIKSVKTFAMESIKKATDTVNNTLELKQLYANMLEYGAKAQINFGYDEDNLANSELTDYRDLVNSSIPVIEDKSTNNLIGNLDHVGFNAYTLSLREKVEIRVTFRTDFYKGGEPLGTLIAKATYEDNSGQPVNWQTTDYTETQTNRYTFYYDDVAAKDMRKLVTFQIYNDNGAVGYSLITSIESVAKKIINDKNSTDATKNVVYAMMNYGDAAAAYFAA